MNPPRLRIKKGAVLYDDSDAVRDLPKPPPPSRRRPAPPRRRRGGIRALLAPLLAIAAALLILSRVIPHAPSNRAVLSGWQATLHVTRYEDGLAVAVTFVARSPLRSPVPAAAASVSLRGTGEQVFLVGDLVRSPMTLRGRLPDVPGAAAVQAEVTIGGARVVLTAPVPPFPH
jgi:hypothetical protein